MKVLAFGDLHNDEAALGELVKKIKEHKPRLLIGVGDIVDYKKLIEMLEPIGGFEFVFVHGNNDNLEDIKKRVSSFSFMHYLHGNIIELLGKKIGGVGGVIGSKERNIQKEKLGSFLSKLGKVDILITHLDPDSKGGDIIESHVNSDKPSYWFYGHAHESDGKIKMMGKTTAINASKPVVLELPD